jgi:hypothetical protein
VPGLPGGGRGPQRNRPWLNFAAQWNADMLAAGGHVIGAGAESAHLVRLTFADGAVLEGAVGNGVVLSFAAPGVAFPARAEIYGAAGDLLAGYEELGDLG